MVGPLESAVGAVIRYSRTVLPYRQKRTLGTVAQEAIGEAIDKHPQVCADARSPGVLHIYAIFALDIHICHPVREYRKLAPHPENEGELTTRRSFQTQSRR